MWFRSVRKGWRRHLGVLAVLCIAGQPVGALSPEIEADRLLMATENYLSSGDYSRAAQALEQMERLQIKLPVEYYFHKGRLAWQARDHDQAQGALEEYVRQTGRDGEHYRQVLQLLTQIEESGTAASAQGAGEAAIQWQEAEQSVYSDDYVENLRKLYLKERGEDALVEHINSLLTAAPYRPSRLITPQQREGTRYQVSLGAKGILQIQQTTYDDQGQAVVSLDRREVFGVDPYVRYGCDRQRRACWLYDPQDSFREWILIGDDAAVVEDLGKAVSKLILLMQNSA